MRTRYHRRTAVHRHTGNKAPAAALRAPLPGEDIALFFDGVEDAVEVDFIIHDFAALHDAEVAADACSS